MVSQLDLEQRTGVMIRKIGADIRKALKEQTEELFSDENIEEDYRMACAKWHITITTYCFDIELMQFLHMLIEEAYLMGKNPDKSSRWRMLMRCILSPQLMKKVGRLTQVPQMSMIDRTEFGKKRDDTRRAMFRKS